jgi:hypothetical protein
LGKNLLRGRMLILGQLCLEPEEKEKAEELINSIWQRDSDYTLYKKRTFQNPKHDEEKILNARKTFARKKSKNQTYIKL